MSTKSAEIKPSIKAKLQLLREKVNPLGKRETQSKSVKTKLQLLRDKLNMK